MDTLPSKLYWAIDNEGIESLETLYYKKVGSLAYALSIPVTLINATYPIKLVEKLGLSKKKKDELHNCREKKTQQQLDALKTQLAKNQIKADFKITTERPFFKEAIKLVNPKENAWMIAQASKKIGIPNIIWQFIRYCPIPMYIAKEKEWDLPLNILVAIDPIHDYDKSTALDHKLLTTAMDIRHQSQATLHVVYCYSPIILASDSSMQKRLERLHREHFHEALSPFDIDTHRVNFVPGDPETNIRDLCLTLDIDLVIMGGVSHNSLERIFIGSTVEKVVPAVNSDLLLIKQ